MRTRKQLTFAEIPAWAIDDASPDRYTVAAAFQLAGLTDRWVRLNAATQRAVFGAYLFGKCSLRLDNDAIHVSRTACFGTDFSDTHFDWVALEQGIASGQRPCL